MKAAAYENTRVSGSTHSIKTHISKPSLANVSLEYWSASSAFRILQHLTGSLYGHSLIQQHCNPGFILRNSCNMASGSISSIAFSIDASPALGVAAGLEPIPAGDYTLNKLPLHHRAEEAEKQNQQQLLSHSHLQTVRRGQWAWCACFGSAFSGKNQSLASLKHARCETQPAAEGKLNFYRGNVPSTWSSSLSSGSPASCLATRPLVGRPQRSPMTLW